MKITEAFDQLEQSALSLVRSVKGHFVSPSSGKPISMVLISVFQAAQPETPYPIARA